MFVDNNSITFGGMMDEYVVRVGEISYTYKVTERGQATDYVDPAKLPSSAPK